MKVGLGGITTGLVGYYRKDIYTNLLDLHSDYTYQLHQKQKEKEEEQCLQQTINKLIENNMPLEQDHQLTSVYTIDLEY